MADRLLRLRPTDSTGDILPVLSVSRMVSGREAAAALARYRLNLHAGEWWENPSHGCEVLRMVREERMTAADRDTLASCLTAYIRQTPGVQAVEDVSAAVSAREFRYACTIRAAGGSAEISYVINS